MKLSRRSLNVLRYISEHQDSMKFPGAVVKKSQLRIADRLISAGYAEYFQTIKGYRLFTTSRGDDQLEQPRTTETKTKIGNATTQLELGI